MSTYTYLCFNIPKFFLSAYHFSHASKISLLTVLNLFFYLKLNHYFLFHLAGHHQKNLIVMIVMLTLKVSPGKLYKRLNYGEKKFFLSLVHKNKIEKKINRKANEIPNY